MKINKKGKWQPVPWFSFILIDTVNVLCHLIFIYSQSTVLPH